MSERLQPQVGTLLAAYARDLARCIPSRGLDARVDRLADSPPETPAAPAPRRRREPVPRWVLAASLAGLALSVGVMVGVRLGDSGLPPRTVTNAHAPTWPPADFPLWPTDSVALKIPARFTSRGTLEAVGDESAAVTSRYWVDVLVSNDGTVRIRNIVPSAGESDAIPPP